MADVVTGNTELGATKQDLILALVQKELAFQSVLGQWFTDLSVFAVPGAKSIAYPKLTSFTVVDRVEAAQGDASVLTATVDTLNLDNNAYIAYILDAMTKKQANINSEMEFAKRAAAAHARYFDSALISVLGPAAAHYQNVGADVDVTFANLQDMRKRFLKNDGNARQGFWLASVAQETVIMGLSQFQKNLEYGGNAVVPDGVIGKIFGMPVIVHNGLADKELYLCEKESVAYGFQSGPAMDSQKANEFGVGAERVAIDQLFGVKALHTDEKSAGAGNSALIFALND
jgi:hypothetical protein